MSDITAALVVEPAAPAHGDTLTATMTVEGNDGTPAVVIEVHGSVSVGGVVVAAPDFALTLPGTDPRPEVFETPTADGLTFTVTDQPNVFTAPVP